jgi:tungstate transport system ATP-binding protein
MPRNAVMDDQARPAGGEVRGHPLLPLAVRDLSYVVGGKVLLEGLSFRLEGRRRTVILGANGAGKSVLMRLCHGLLRPSAGSIRWADAPATEVMQRQAMVFQRPVVLRRSVAANIEHSLAVRGIERSRRPALVAEALARAGLDHKAAQAARTLSGGEQQRMVIARAAVLQPEVLLLDEPTSNLDPEATWAVEELIRTVDAAGTKIIMTTHDIAQARRLAEDVLFLHRGVLLEHSPAPGFFESPGHPAARRFLEGALLA